MKFSTHRILFLISVCVFFFLWGFLAHSFSFFPHSIFSPLLQFAEERFTGSGFIDRLEYSRLFFPNDTNRIHSSTDNVHSTVFSGTENILTVGYEPKHPPKSKSGLTVARIIDRQGRNIHNWTIPADTWIDLPNHQILTQNPVIYPVGAHLFENGDLLLSFHSDEVFPYAVGLVKLDRNSNIIWKSNQYYHHRFEVYEDGLIFVPMIQMVSSPLLWGSHNIFFQCESGIILADQVAVLDPDGNIIRIIDPIRSLENSDLLGLLNSNSNNSDQITTCDPLHLTDVVVPESSDGISDNASELVLAFSAVNTLIRLDLKTMHSRILLHGNTQLPQSPVAASRECWVYADFDSRKFSTGSAVHSVCSQSGNHREIWTSPGPHLKANESIYRSTVMLDISADSNRLLLAHVPSSRVIELDTRTGEEVWRFCRDWEIDGIGGKLPVTFAAYVRQNNKFWKTETK